MSLPAASPRKHKHTRTIVCEGFEREDGLFDVDARIVDVKTFDVDHIKRGRIPAGTRIHDMQLRLTVDDKKVVRDIAVSTNQGPYDLCFTVAPTFRKLIGASLTSGWRKAVKDAVGGNQSCTHLRDLLGPAATTAMQTIGGGQRAMRAAQANTDPDAPKPFFLNGCKAMAEDGELVRELLPLFYVKPVN